MQIDLNTLFVVGVPTIGVVVWLVRLEGRINVSESRFSDITNRLIRIETKIDNNGK